MKYRFLAAGLLILLSACSSDGDQEVIEDEVLGEESTAVEEDESGGENQEEADDGGEAQEPLEPEYYEISDLSRELTDVEEKLMRMEGPYHGDQFDADAVMEELSHIDEHTSEEEAFEAILSLIHEPYYEDVEQVIAFNPDIEVDSETPEEEAPDEDELPSTSHFSILLDASGSMNARNQSGTRMDEAKEAIEAFVATLPENSTTSLRVYGHEGDNTNAGKELSCSSTDTIYHGETDADALSEVLDDVDAVGWTPIAKAIEDSQDDIPEDATDVIVYIVSDGIETCGGDPVKAAQELVDQDIEPIINIIGFQVEDDDYQSLIDVAEAGNGEFTFVDSKQELESYWEEEYRRMMDAWNEWKRAAMDEVNERSAELKDQANELKDSIMEKSNDEWANAQVIIDRLVEEEQIESSVRRDLWSRFYNRKNENWSYGYNTGVENWSNAYNEGIDRWREVYHLGNEKWSEYYNK
ncbi:vWA domain-containing protein [Alteribacter aurantiacus]|uniref:vWA domain-containing protein n=1 Tax=Alteribacter aurantiacus TaxID=254410 RepID=UPI0003FD402A|nr:VWA domain-containing protein [Alteribacter aurantiacus]